MLEKQNRNNPQIA